MPMVFYPHEDDLESSSLEEKIEILSEAAERYKAAVLDPSKGETADPSRRMVPKDIGIAFNWEEISKVLNQIRQLPEATSANKLIKAEKLTKLAEVYEVLRAAKMPKLEAVRIALVNEANQLRSSAAAGA